jgi:dethiobiotin synthetase
MPDDARKGAARAQGWFVTGSDTGVGKSWLTVRLLRELRSMFLRSVGFKPIACGDREDGLALLAAGDPSLGLTLNEVNPVCYQAPAAPYTASVIEGRPLDWALLDSAWKKIEQLAEIVLVEGAGGVMTPVDASWTMRDLATRWELKVIVVTPNRLGALSQALCSVDCLEHIGATVEAVVLNGWEHQDAALCQTNIAVLEERLPGRIFETDTDGIRRLAKKIASSL